jgi:hypothetical protein
MIGILLTSVRIFDKLGVSDRLELALYAIHKNIHTPV